MKRIYALILAVLCLMHGVGVSEFGGTVVNGLYYSGAAMFDEKTGVLKFVSSGTIQDPGKKEAYSYSEKVDGFLLDASYNVYNVPKNVKKIVIGKGVQVKGRFDVRNDLTIEGEDRETSVIYGTDDLRYSHNRGDVYGVQWDTPWSYSAINVTGAATVYVDNLTVKNPYGYCISGYAENAVIHCSKVNMIDDRGGDQNNSDGFIGQAGSSLEDVFICTGDDAIKVYHDLTMTNVEIVMLHNGAPIQFGWNADDDCDTDVVINNLIIKTKDDIRSYNRGVFSWVSADNRKTINVTAENVVIDVPYAKLYELNTPYGTLNMVLKHAYINTKGNGEWKPKGEAKITY